MKCFDGFTSTQFGYQGDIFGLGQTFQQMINGGKIGFPKKTYDKEIEKIILSMLHSDRYERPKPEASIKLFKKIKEKSDAKIKLANRMDPNSYKKPKHETPYVI
jgi:hypothetical protein